jgi:hypothetical protein
MFRLGFWNDIGLVTISTNRENMADSSATTDAANYIEGCNFSGNLLTPCIGMEIRTPQFLD